MTSAELRTIRKSLHLTQKQLAEKLGVHWVTVAHYEGGKPIPRPMELLVRTLKPESQTPSPA